MYHSRLLSTCGISIAGFDIARTIRLLDLLIQSLDPRWGFGVGWLGVTIHLQDFYRTGISIAFAIRSLDLFTRLRDFYRTRYSLV